MNSSFLFRLKIVAGVIVVIMLLICAKLFFVQVMHHSDYVLEADGQYTTKSNGLFNRGIIYFTKKDGSKVSAATLEDTYKLIMVPKDIKNIDEVYKRTIEIVPVDFETFNRKASKTGDPYEELLNYISDSDAELIRKAKIPGITIETTKKRFYPGESLASRVLGFVSYKGDDLSGRYGLERSYNDVLVRTKDDLYVNFFAELFTNLNKTLFRDEHSQGDVVTSIEPEVQHSLEQTLSKVKNEWQMDQIGGIVLDPRTGEIIAMSVLPDFNINEFGNVKDVSFYGNPLIENAFELGSIVKPLTLAAGLDAGVITPTSTYNDTGCVTLNTEHICNFDKKARRTTSMQTVLDQSLNMGAAFVEQKLGKEKFRSYFYKYGMNEKTNIDLPGEINNIISNLQSPREIEYATASFGQGIALTPISAIRAFTALAHGGTLVQPHVVRSIVYSDGIEKKMVYDEGEQILKPETVESISRMLVSVVDTALLGGKRKFERYTVAAKTGTAQMALENGRGYYPDKYLHSMFGYYPAYEPRFLVLMYGINPKDAQFSVQTLGNGFMDLAKFLLTYYDVPPDR